MWASNAIVGRLSVAGSEPLISPLTLNAARWVVTLLILAGIASLVPRRGRAAAPPPAGSGAARGEGESRRPPAGAMAHLRGVRMLSVASYNALQYMALRTSSAINVTLIASGGRLFVLADRRLLFAAHARRCLDRASCRWSACSSCHRRGGRTAAALRLASGDLLMVVATIVWALLCAAPLAPGRPVLTPAADANRRGASRSRCRWWPRVACRRLRAAPRRAYRRHRALGGARPVAARLLVLGHRPSPAPGPCCHRSSRTSPRCPRLDVGGTAG